MGFSLTGVALLAFALFMLFSDIAHVRDKDSSHDNKSWVILVLFVGLLVGIYLLNHE